jgi:TPR repeat protein
VSVWFALVTSVCCLGIAPAQAAPAKSHAVVLVEEGIKAYQKGDYTTSARIFEQAAVLGDANAMYRLGYQHERGLGMEADGKLALRWFEEAAKRGDTDAMNGLSAIYYYGYGVTADTCAAHQWTHKALELDGKNRTALFNMGYDYYYGNCVIRDLAQARKYWQKGADLGDDDARFNLALLDKRPASNNSAGWTPPPKSDDCDATCEAQQRDADDGRYEPPPPPPPAYVAPIAPLYGEPCWGC